MADGRCTGHCCDGFTLNQSPGELQALAAGGEGDAAQIVGLLKVKSYSDDGRTFLLRYRCKALQPNGDCGIYETRPRMCVNYPNFVLRDDRVIPQPCRVSGCTLGVEGRCV